MNLTSSMASLAASCSTFLWLSNASLVHVPSPYGNVLNIRPRTFNLQPICGFSGAWISATFMRNMSWIYCARWIIWVRFNLYSACTHQPALLRCFRCYQCCEAAAGTPQLISASMPHLLDQDINSLDHTATNLVQIN